MIKDPNLLILKYCEDHSSQVPKSLSAIEKNTHLKTTKAQDSSDFVQGRILSFISKMLKPKAILELGTFTAYGTCCLAEGLSNGGKIITIEGNESYKEIIEDHIKLAGLSDVVTPLFGQAKEILLALSEAWDLIFIDANKLEYLDYYNLTVDQLRSGGLIIADNILWKGKVVEKNMDTHLF